MWAEQMLMEGFYEHDEEDKLSSLPVDCYLNTLKDMDTDDGPAFEVSISAKSPLNEVFTCVHDFPKEAAIGCFQMAVDAYKVLMSIAG